MTRTRALIALLASMARELVLSGWSTARVILAGRSAIQPGFARLAYGDLSPAGASLLAAMVTLTPGTTALEIDHERRELLLHLLDQRQAEATLAAIERDFIHPLRQLFADTP